MFERLFFWIHGVPCEFMQIAYSVHMGIFTFAPRCMTHILSWCYPNSRQCWTRRSVDVSRCDWEFQVDPFFQIRGNIGNCKQTPLMHPRKSEEVDNDLRNHKHVSVTLWDNYMVIIWHHKNELPLARFPGRVSESRTLNDLHFASRRCAWESHAQGMVGWQCCKFSVGSIYIYI